jgi:2-succinyl-5-enolpyruvyl-6-hydroxy-3-cyclohexene-1-carboxylate synthase
VSGPTLAVIGDLTAQHDLGSLALMRDRPLVLVVCNNGGGGIFDLLPQAGLPEFEHGWRTPQQLDFGHAAAAFGIAFQRTEDVGLAVAEALSALAEMRPLLIELLIDREDSLLLRQAL